MIQEMEEKMQTIRQRIKEAQDRHKSYVDVHSVDRRYEVSDKGSCTTTREVEGEVWTAALPQPTSTPVVA